MIWLLFPLFRAGFQQGAAAMLTFGRMGATAQISKKSGKQKCNHFTLVIGQTMLDIQCPSIQSQK